MPTTNRRDFLKAAAAAGITYTTTSSLLAQNIPTGERVVIGVIGSGSRGTQHAVGFAGLPGVHVKYVCDVDEAHANSAAKATEKKAAANDNTPAPIPVR